MRRNECKVFSIIDFLSKFLLVKLYLSNEHN